MGGKKRSLNNASAKPRLPTCAFCYFRHVPCSPSCVAFQYLGPWTADQLITLGPVWSAFGPTIFFPDGERRSTKNRIQDPKVFEERIQRALADLKKNEVQWEDLHETGKVRRIRKSKKRRTEALQCEVARENSGDCQEMKTLNSNQQRSPQKMNISYLTTPSDESSLSSGPSSPTAEQFSTETAAALLSLASYESDTTTKVSVYPKTSFFQIPSSVYSTSFTSFTSSSSTLHFASQTAPFRKFTMDTKITQSSLTSATV